VDAPVDPPSVIPASTGSAPVRVADGAIRMLDPRVISLNRTIAAIVGVVIAGIHLIVAATLALTRGLHADTIVVSLAWFPLTALLVWLTVRWPHIDYRYWRYRVDDNGIEIWSGVIWRLAVAVPRSRVQHIDVSQGPIERSSGLATLSIHTAGTQYSKVDLPGLDHAVALAVRDALLPKDAEPAV
jgi:uncharacterized protein